MKAKHIRKRMLFAAVLCILFYCMFVISHDISKKQNAQMEKESIKETGLTIYYTNENFSDFINKAAEEYKKEKGIAVKAQLVSTSEYLENIAAGSTNGDESTPDLYIVREELLENAYALGITSENKSDKFNEDNFAKTALDSVSYHGKKIAYPLCFHTACFVYRSDLISMPSYLEQIDTCDISSLAENGMEKSIDFNTGNILCEYAFIGKYINVGGDAGDASEVMQIDEDMVGKSMMFYQQLITDTGISHDAKEESMILGYAEGKNLSLILSSDYIKLLDDYSKNMGTVYALAQIPNLTEMLQSITGSYTDSVVVNGMSVNQDEAADFAEFLTCEYSDKLFSMTNIYPAKYDSGKSIDNFDVIYNIYKNSDTFPKLLKTEDFSLKVKELFENVSNGEDTMTEVSKFSESMKHRISS